jgi:hypothetical protein
MEILLRHLPKGSLGPEFEHATSRIQNISSVLHIM